MGNLSEDDSSDSSNEFLVSPDKIGLSSSFFKQAETKKINPKKVPVVQEDSDDSDFDYVNDDNNATSAELLSQVLKNLENVQNQYRIAESNKSEASIKTEPSTSESKGNDLSQEISSLLLQGESAATLSKNDDEDENKDSKVEVKQEYSIPDKGVQIHLPGENFVLDKKQKKQLDLRRLLQNKINHRIRTTQVLAHKVGLLTWLAHGFFLNKLANDSDLLGITLSLVSSNNYPKGRVDLKYLEKFTKWFASIFKVNEKNKEIVYSKDSLMKRVTDKQVDNYVELVLLYIAVIRGMGINCRLVISLQPPRLKPKPEQLFKIKTSENEINLKPESKTTQVKAGKGRGKSKSEKVVSPSKVPENSREASKTANEEAKKKAAAILKGKKAVKSEDGNTGIEKNKANQVNVRTRKSKQMENSEETIEDSSDEEKEDTGKILSIAEKLSRFKRETKPRKAKISTEKKNKKKKSNETAKSSKKRRHSSDEEYSEESNDSDEFYESEESKDIEESDFSTDDEYVEKKPKKKTPKRTNSKQKTTPKAARNSLNKSNSDKNRKLLSSDEDDMIGGYNVWIEVYVESEESWISVDVLDKKIHCVTEIFKKAGQPVLYIIAWNSNGTLKDVTRRYCPHWLTDTRKKRVDEKWWNDTLSSWKERKTAMSKAEDEQLLQRELEQPLPKTVGECKGHPLYVLTRHLLKFEALYPPDCVPLGHLKTGEAIYSRHCVHTLRSRETWLKQARVVKPAQEAYKFVKSLPKYDKLSGSVIKGQPLELFGKWQTGPYIPPEAKDGKVPRNEYGNVDLFKMCMLPKGTVYINLPALNRLARKLKIDCAPACIGFNFGCRGALPAFEGFVVCEEYEDTLRDAWEEEQIEAKKRAEEKREKRIYGNWKKLIKGLLIREKLAAKYNFGDQEKEEEEEEEEEEEIVYDHEKEEEKPDIKKKKVTPAKKKNSPVKKEEKKKDSPAKKEEEKKDSPVKKEKKKTVPEPTTATRSSKRTKKESTNPRKKVKR